MKYKLTAKEDIEVTAFVAYQGSDTLPPNHRGEYQGTVPREKTKEIEFNLKAGESRSDVTLITLLVVGGRQVFHIVDHPQKTGEIKVTGPLEVEAIG
jgi:hypothetical protein